MWRLNGAVLMIAKEDEALKDCEWVHAPGRMRVSSGVLDALSEKRDDLVVILMLRWSA